MPLPKSRGQCSKQFIRHLPFSWSLQPVVVFPDRTRLAATVADVIEIENNDGKRLDAVQMLLLRNLVGELRVFEYDTQSKTLDLGLSISKQPVGNQTYFPRRRIEPQLVAPRTERLKGCRLPASQLDVRDCGESRV